MLNKKNYSAQLKRAKCSHVRAPPLFSIPFPSSKRFLSGLEYRITWRQSGLLKPSKSLHYCLLRIQLHVLRNIRTDSVEMNEMK